MGGLLLHVGAQAFSNAIFGPASYALPIHLDKVECNGNEKQLAHCWTHKDTKKCLHSGDASVDCLGRSVGMQQNNVILWLYQLVPSNIKIVK